VNSQDPSVGENSRFDALLFWFLLSVVVVASLATISSTLFVLIHEYLRLPHSDEWDMIAHWNSEWRSPDSSWLRFFDQHNEHRIALPRLIFFADLHWFRGAWFLTFGCLVLIQLLHAMLLARLISAALRSRTRSRLIVAGLVFILMFSALQIRNIVWGFQIQFVGVFFLGSIAFYFLLGPPAKKATIQLPWQSSFLIGVLFCIAATFTMANGLLVWLVGMIIGIQQRWSLKRNLLFLGFASITWAAYFVDFQFISGHSNPWKEIDQFWTLLQYVAVYLGNPISPYWRDYAMGVGLMGIVATGFLSIRFIFDRNQKIYDSRATQTLLAIVVFIFLTAWVTALGRIEFGVQQATSSRYGTPALIFWISLCALLLSIKVRSCLLSRGLRYIGTVIGISAIVSALTFQFKIPEIEMHFAQTRSAATASLLSKVYDESALKHIHPRPSQIMSVVDTLREKRLSLFSMEIAALIDQSLEQSLAITARDHCAGHIDQVTGLASDRNSFRLRGWAIDKTRDKPADTIIFVSEDLIRGVAFSGVERQDVEKHYPEIKRSGWFGYARVNPGATLRAYALIHDNQSACLLNGSYRH